MQVERITGALLPHLPYFLSATPQAIAYPQEKPSKTCLRTRFIIQRWERTRRQTYSATHVSHDGNGPHLCVEGVVCRGHLDKGTARQIVLPRGVLLRAPSHFMRSVGAVVRSSRGLFRGRSRGSCSAFVSRHTAVRMTAVSVTSAGTVSWHEFEDAWFWHVNVRVVLPSARVQDDAEDAWTNIPVTGTWKPDNVRRCL